MHFLLRPHGSSWALCPLCLCAQPFPLVALFNRVAPVLIWEGQGPRLAYELWAIFQNSSPGGRSGAAAHRGSGRGDMEDRRGGRSEGAGSLQELIDQLHYVLEVGTELEYLVAFYFRAPTALARLGAGDILSASNDPASERGARYPAHTRAGAGSAHACHDKRDSHLRRKTWGRARACRGRNKIKAGRWVRVQAACPRMLPPPQSQRDMLGIASSLFPQAFLSMAFSRSTDDS